MDKRIKIGIGALLTLIAGGVGVTQFGAGEKVMLNDPQIIVWDKPTTDAEWAEDVKAENFDVRSTKKLEEMRDVHAKKLTRMEEALSRVFDCSECEKYDIQKSDTSLSPQEVDTLYQRKLDGAAWEIEKLKQSVERMDKELDLRGKGFVMVEGEKGRGLFGGTVPPDRIRYIHD